MKCQRCGVEHTGKRKNCENCLRFFRNYYTQTRKADAVSLLICIDCSKPRKSKGLRCFECALIATERAKVFNEKNKITIKERRKK